MMRSLWIVLAALALHLSLSVAANVAVPRGGGSANVRTATDPDNPISFLGHAIVYDGDTLTLGERAMFVDGSLSDADIANSPFAFNSFVEAAKHFVDGTPDNPMRVYIAPWVYWIDNPDTPSVAYGRDGREPFGIVVRCHNLHLVGLNPDARNVVLAAQRGHTQGAMGNFTMIDFHGDGLQVSNMTLGNYCNVDLDFPLVPSLSRPKRSAAITQAHVAYCHGDRALCRNVRFISRLNLNPINGARRILYDHCHLECTDDALTGNGIYLNCTIDLYGQKPFYTTARTGAVFLACHFTSKTANRRMVFCKAPGPLALIDCTYSAPDSTYVGWANYPEPWLRCYQSNFRLNGAPYVIGGELPCNTVTIDSLPLLNAYRMVANGDTLYNICNLVSGDDGWDPLSTASRFETALGAMACRQPTSLAVNMRQATITAGDLQPLTLQAKAMRQGGYAMPSDADTTAIDWALEPGGERYVRLTPCGRGRCVAQSINDGDTAVTVCAIASTPSGLQAAVQITAKPQLLAAPVMQGKPQIIMGDTLRLLYALDLGGRDDKSRITWYRCTDAAGSNAKVVAVSRMGEPLDFYPLTEADRGWHIMASIEPMHVRSEAGEAVTVVTAKPIAASMTSIQTVVETDFRNMPTQWQPEILPGFWTVDGHKPSDTAGYQWEFDTSKDMWGYSKGFNGAVGWGLVQAQRGARLLYTPVSPDCGDMRVTLLVDPTKTAGQGFGSATGQYMDVYIKMDTRTLTGYALRIERTPRHAKAVDFTLMEYCNGVTRPISRSVTSSCYRTGCTIRLEIIGNRFAAHVETASPKQAGSSLPSEVDLAATIKPNRHGGSGVQHTGSCGESTTMLHNMRIEYVAD